VSVTCPCGSPRTVLHERKEVSSLRLAGNQVEVVRLPASRRLCRSCGRTFVEKDPVAASLERKAAEHLARLTFRLGRAGACRESGLGEKRLDRVLRQWREGRESEREEVESDFLLIGTALQRGDDRILVVDADRETLVEVLDGGASLGAWLARDGVATPLNVCIPLDAGIAACVRRSLPGTAVLVAPSVVRRAIRTALASGLSALRRLPGLLGCNAMPGTARFLRAFDGRAPRGDGWPREVLGLLAAGEGARRITTTQAPDGLRQAWREFEILVDVPGGRPLARLMATWQGEITEGIGHRFVDRIAGLTDRLSRQATLYRPALAFEDFRSLVLLMDTSEPAGPGLERAAGTLRTPEA
jgi:hypothetical protein